MPTTEATAEVKAIFSVIDQASAPIQKITESLNGVAAAAKDVAVDIPHSLAEVAERAGVAWRPGDIVAPVTPAVTEQVTAAAGAIAPAVSDQIGAATVEIDKVSGHWTHLRDSITRVADTIGDTLRSTFESVERVAGSVAGRISKAWQALGGDLAAVGLGAAIETGIEYAFHGMEKLVQEVEKLEPAASAIGIPIAKLQDLHRWAEDAGVPVSALDKALENLTKTLGQVQAGGNRAATAALDDLGVSVTDAHGTLRSTADVLPEVIDALHQIDEPTRRAAEAGALFGRNWKDIPQLLDATSQNLAKATAEQEKVGHLTDAQVERAKDYEAAHKRMTESLDHLQETIGANLLPAITPLEDAITTIAGDFNQWAQSADAAKGSMEFMQELAGYMKSTATDVEEVMKGVQWITDHLNALAAWKPPTAWSLFTQGLGAFKPPAVPEGPPVPTAPGGGPLTFESLAAPAPPLLPGAAPSGTVDVNVNVTHANPPPGTRVDVGTKTSGNGLRTTTATGWSMPQIQTPWAAPPVQAPWAPPA
jgi:hypothetical protein